MSVTSRRNPAHLDDVSDPSFVGAPADAPHGEQPSNNIASVSGLHNPSRDSVNPVQAYHANSATIPSHSEGRLSHASSAPSLTHLTREARYASAEAALRTALSQCDTEPSPLELQVRVMEKGLQAWTARVGRGYDRVRKAEDALAAVCRPEGHPGMARGSMGDLQREKWMGIKERDEALEMVEKIKGLIVELNTDIKRGVKAHSQTKISDPLPPKTLDEISNSTVNDTCSQRAPILFSRKLPPPYLHNLPRSRRSVEPLRLGPGQPHVTSLTSPSRRKRSSTLRSESVSNPPSSSTTESSTPQPSTPTNTSDGFGAALIHIPLPPKSMAQYIAEMHESSISDVALDPKHVPQLPSYVGDLLDELSEDRIGATNLGLGNAFDTSPLNSSSSSSSGPPSSPLPNWGILRSSPHAPSMRTLPKRRSKAFLGHTFSSPSNAPPLPTSPAQSPRSNGDDDISMALRVPGSDSAAAFEKLLQTLSRTSSPTRDGSHVVSQQHAKSPGRMGNIVQNVRKGVKRAVRME